MAENWIKLYKNQMYEITGGGTKGESGICVEIREGHFGRSWGRITFPALRTSTWIRASHLTPIEPEKKRYTLHRGS